MAETKRVAIEQIDESPLLERSSADGGVEPLNTKPLVNPNRLAPGFVGARLRERRLARGISLRQFARDIDVSASFISQLETGKAQPSVATFYSICTALDTSVDELFADYESATAKSLVDQGRPTDAANNRWRTDELGGGAQILDESQIHHDSSPVVQPHERRVLVLDSGVTWESLTSSHHDKTDFMFVRYEVGGSSTLEGRLMRHVGTEYGYMLKGTLEVTVGFESYVISAGDSISFDSSRPHRFINIGDEPVEAIWVNLEFRSR